MKTRRKPVVGETLYMLNVGNAARHRTQVLKPTVVDSVGRKYFRCLGGFYHNIITEFCLEDWSERTEYSANYALYETEQEYQDQKETGRITERIKKTFDMWSRANISLQDLRDINAILDRAEHARKQTT